MRGRALHSTEMRFLIYLFRLSLSLSSFFLSSLFRSLIFHLSSTLGPTKPSVAFFYVFSRKHSFFALLRKEYIGSMYNHYTTWRLKTLPSLTTHTHTPFIRTEEHSIINTDSIYRPNNISAICLSDKTARSTFTFGKVDKSFEGK